MSERIKELLKDRENNKLVWHEYVEVLPNQGVHVQNIANVEVCLQLQKNHYIRQGASFLAEQDESLVLSDFLITNWAAKCGEDTNEKDNSDK